MASLFKHLRVHQIFGANTDVGKTILTTALVLASASRKIPVHYLKPISTGPLEEADDHHVKRYGRHEGSLISAECLFRYKEPVSPHLAAKLSSEDELNLPSDETFINAIANRIRRCAANIREPAHMYVETAGGIHSPTVSGTTQVDCYRPLFLPTILVGDSKLGGISTTIASYESLLLRGYIIDAIVVFRDHYYRNWEYLNPYFLERGVELFVVDPPPIPTDPSKNLTITENYYQSIISSEKEDGMAAIMNHLDTKHKNRLNELESMPRRTLDTIWWPFVQHGSIQKEENVTVIDSAHSDFFSVTRQNALHDKSVNESVLAPEFDGSASWWTQTFGHAHPALTLAAARASGRYGHVMFPENIHLPALKLAERLVHGGPGKGWASRAFFSDNGSTGMEVALKMALRAFSVRHKHELEGRKKKELGVLGLKGSYHGDTIGAMDACEEGVYTCEWHNARGYWFEPPTVGIRDGVVTISIPPAFSASTRGHDIKAESLSWVYDIEARLRSPLALMYGSFIQQTMKKLEQDGPKLAALALEPLVMGAGGMIFVDPLFQRVLIDVVRGRRSGPSSEWSGLPVIFDEVFVGLQRIGMESTSALLGVHPDISVNAKILTGGLVPLAVTLASNSIFQAFLSGNKADALLHGHSYTAHPIGCEVANETLSLIDKVTASDNWKAAQAKWDKPDGSLGKVWSLWDPVFVTELSKLERVEEVMTMGCVLSIHLKDASAGYSSNSARALLEPLKRCVDIGPEFSSAPGGAPFGIHFRTLGNVAYFMTSLNTSPSVISSVEDRIWQAITE